MSALDVTCEYVEALRACQSEDGDIYKPHIDTHAGRSSAVALQHGRGQKNVRREIEELLMSRTAVRRLSVFQAESGVECPMEPNAQPPLVADG